MTTTNQPAAASANTSNDEPCCAPTCCAPSADVTSESQSTKDGIRDEVRAVYAKVARGDGGCCAPAAATQDSATRASLGLGYQQEDLAALSNANLGVGCGNPTAIANLKPGQVVVDLGSGAGLDALLAAREVGAEGRVIGVDMTPEMLARARANAVEAGVADRVEFREGTIEQLPITNDSVDVIISNCVINLSPDKARVFREAHRVLRSGGKLVVSDILLSAPLPEIVRNHPAAYAACVSGATLESDYIGALKQAGFDDIQMKKRSAADMMEAAIDAMDLREAAAALPADVLDRTMKSLWSYDIEATKR